MSSQPTTPPSDPPSSDRLVIIFAAIRRVTVFALGVWIISAALVDTESQGTIPMLIIGMVMVGVLPIEDALPLGWRRRR